MWYLTILLDDAGLYDEYMMYDCGRYLGAARHNRIVYRSKKAFKNIQDIWDYRRQAIQYDETTGVLDTSYNNFYENFTMEEPS